MIWFAPFHGLGEEEPFPRPGVAPGASDDGEPADDDDQSRRSSASTRIDGVRGDAAAVARVAHPLAGLRLHADPRDVEPEHVRERVAHRGTAAKASALNDDRRVDVRDRPAVPHGELVARREQPQRVGVLPLLVGVGKVRAEIAERARTEERVADRVGQHVAVAVSERAAVVVDAHAADDERPPFDQPVRVEAVPDAIAFVHGISARDRPASPPAARGARGGW